MRGESSGRVCLFSQWLLHLLAVGCLLGGGISTAWASSGRQQWLPRPVACLQDWMVPGVRGPLVQTWIESANTAAASHGGWVATGASLDGAEVRIWLAPSPANTGSPAVGALVLWPAACARSDAQVIGSFAFLTAGATQPDPRLVAKLKAAVSNSDDGHFFAVRAPRIDPFVTQAERLAAEHALLVSRDNQAIAWTFGVLALGYTLVLVALRRGAPFRVRVHYRRHHLLPVALQCVIYLYWSMYFPAVRDRVPWILTQVVLAYLLDGLFLLWRKREFHLGLSPLPVVGSLNLFLWAPPGAAWVTLLALACAFGSKALIRRGDVHLMNPSAFGAAFVGVLTLLPGLTVPYIDISHQFGLPPNMTELILLLVLLPQTILPIVPASLGALVTMTILQNSGVFDTAAVLRAGLDPLWAPGFIAITLLITDPMTLPRRPDARVFTGVLFGVLVFAMSAATTAYGHSDYFAKVWPVPIINLLAPRLESWGARLEDWRATGWLARGLSPRHNRVHMLVFFGFCVLELHHLNRKAGNLQTLESHGWLDGGQSQPKHVGDEQVRCAAHPAWCTPFSFAMELSLPPPTFPPAVVPQK